MPRQPAMILGLIAACALAGTAPPAPAEGSGAGVWKTLEPGLEFGELAAPRPGAAGDSLIRVLRIDPRRFELVLLNASAPGEGRKRTAREWARRHGLLAAINASMYQTDQRTSVSLMRTRGHVNNSRLSKDKTILAFDPLDASAPPVKLIDRECDDFEAWRARYGTLVQSIRMIACDGRNVWRQQPARWSTAAAGVDLRGRVLFIHVASPYSTHDLIEILRDLPLEIRGAMYLEGGPEAQLYFAAGGIERELYGNRQAAPGEGGGGAGARPVPNVLGVARRAAGSP